MIIKLILAIFVVILLSSVAERLSPRWAGILGGFPTGAAITLFFFAKEQGLEFTSQAAVFNIMGIVAGQAFGLFYCLGAGFGRKPNMAICLLTGLVGFFLVAIGLDTLQLTKTMIVTITFLSVPFYLFMLRNVQETKIQAKKLEARDLVFRGLFSGILILIVTEVAKAAGAHWAGLFSAFPVTFCPLMLIIHFKYGIGPVKTMVKSFPIGVLSLILFSLTLSLDIELLGLTKGFLVAFGVAALYLLLFQASRKIIALIIVSRNHLMPFGK